MRNTLAVQNLWIKSENQEVQR